MLFKQIYEPDLAQASYLIGCQANGTAVVVDPRRDISVYLEEAGKNGLSIVAVTETHIHADYLSGARELAKATGAALYLSGEGGQDWQYKGLEGLKHVLINDGDEIKIGNVRLQALHTPGHTPEHISFLVTDGATTDKPGFVLTGDFVFVGDIGRPDLLEEAAGQAGTAEPGARRMFQSIQEKFLTLPDYVQVWPGHGAGSACGKALGAVPSTTVGYERRFAWWADYLAANHQAQFVQTLLADQPEAPSYFSMMKKLNRDGMPILARLPEPAKLAAEEFQKLLAGGAVLVDTRDKLAFAGGHIKGAINIPATKNFSTWAGWLLPYDKPLVLVANPELIPDLAAKLIRVGLDNIVGFIPDLEGYAESELETVPQVTVLETEAKWRRGEAVILDVRAADEYKSGHIPGALNLHAGRVMRNLQRVPKDRPVVLHCASGDRSSTAISALLAAGYTNVMNLTGGIRAWQEQGFLLETASDQGLTSHKEKSSV